ncbi:MAG: hypothetical protein NVS3B20_17720 [Polyangiales bacterium]
MRTRPVMNQCGVDANVVFDATGTDALFPIDEVPNEDAPRSLDGDASPASPPDGTTDECMFPDDALASDKGDIGLY